MNTQHKHLTHFISSAQKSKIQNYIKWQGKTECLKKFTFFFLFFFWNKQDWDKIYRADELLKEARALMVPALIITT